MNQTRRRSRIRTSTSSLALAAISRTRIPTLPVGIVPPDAMLGRRVLILADNRGTSSLPRIRTRLEPLLLLHRAAGPQFQWIPAGARSAGRSTDRFDLRLEPSRDDRRGLPRAIRDPQRGSVQSDE